MLDVLRWLGARRVRLAGCWTCYVGWVLDVLGWLGVGRVKFLYDSSSSSSSSRTSDGQSSLADKCCSPLQIREAAVELLGLQSWLGPGPHSQFFIQFTPL